MTKRKVAKVFQYTAVFEPEEKGGYSVIIPALPGCISEGDSFEEALKNIKEATELYLEDLKEQEIPREEKPIIVSPIQVSL
ncbi:antitoxin HicB [Candidatus Daviesbacteria bacterium RIFCSPLOWO2_01_FULL_38_10]|nr:MAG: antitoxin HicB [Candidatus Daviesbacteria bacterium RIFCSPHIGHO2_02_FULL_39_41]OGE37055.1 MAG: antitoxin HicB [Candidatus Daviesbacteria bacterium RIFCSPLOWO2_01_FULL_38_10]OGE43965.1 MAG: antitoxin HicB [Candidatus Daviesbacteria bacterium RIFCSPHIGHO2_12_FULL_38_25]OGE67162.1 MAG: antitoxin HicB [Candidatus Daviesbacteria bacterium RIFCSPLOWO2_02_FULL_38_18]OGE73487.1 MAG: antitoxin HicB [Candidatus Daviesbacteria bacterium RIFCSPLOWO2_12_FULL_38_10]HCB22997.1 HicB family protein [Ca